MAELQSVNATLKANANPFKAAMGEASGAAAGFSKELKKSKNDLDFFGGGMKALADTVAKEQKKLQYDPKHGFTKGVIEEEKKLAEAAAKMRFTFKGLGESLQTVHGPTDFLGKGLSKLNPTLLGVGAAAGAAVAGLAAVGVAAYAMVSPLVEARQKANDLGMQLGTSPEFIEKFTKAAGSLRISSEDAGDAISDFAEKLGKAQIGDTDLEKFQLVGLSLEDIKDADPSEVLIKALGHINQLGTAAQRQSAAVELFGDKGKELLRVSQLGEQGIRDLLQAQPVSSVGGSLDEITKHLTTITEGAKAFGAALGEYVVPVVETITGALAGVVEYFQGPSTTSTSKPKPIQEEVRRTITLQSSDDQTDARKAAVEQGKKLVSLQKEVVSLSDKNASLWNKISEDFKESTLQVKTMVFELEKVKASTMAIEGLRAQSVGGADDAAFDQINDLRKYSDATKEELQSLRVQAENALKTGLGGSLTPADIRREALSKIDADRYLNDEEKGTARKNADRAYLRDQRAFLEGLGKITTPLESVSVKLEELAHQAEIGAITGDQFKELVGNLANERAGDRDNNRLANAYVVGSTAAASRIAQWQAGYDRNNDARQTAKNTKDMLTELKTLNRNLPKAVSSMEEDL